MIVATKQDPKTAIYAYLRRWEIENVFGALKTKGFCFESTHLTKLERVAKLMALLVVGFCWAHKIGEWRAEMKPIKWSHHRNVRQPHLTYFGYGLDFIRDIILHSYQKSSDFKKIIQPLKLIPRSNWELSC